MIRLRSLFKPVVSRSNTTTHGTSGRASLGHSKFRGVSKRFEKGRWTGKWAAAIQHKYITQGKSIHLGCFDNEDKAARAYDGALMTIPGMHPDRRNFPGDPIPTDAEIIEMRKKLSDRAVSLNTIGRAAVRRSLLEAVGRGG